MAVRQGISFFVDTAEVGGIEQSQGTVRFSRTSTRITFIHLGGSYPLHS